MKAFKEGNNETPTIQQADALLAEPPYPVLLNAWKHHAGALRQRIALAARAGETALQNLANRLVVIGTELMDLYTGRFAPAEIGNKVLAALKAEDRLAPETYREWLRAGGGYQVHTFPEDASRWVLRLGEEDGRYVHVHPARWAPQTLRVRANVLKTAVLVLAYAGIRGGDPLDVALINAVRKDYLGLSPIRALAGDLGLRGLLDMLRDPARQKFPTV